MAASKRFEEAPYRVHFDKVPYTLMQRIALWARGVRYALLQAPPRSRTRETKVWPGDRRWDSAVSVGWEWLNIEVELGVQDGNRK